MKVDEREIDIGEKIVRVKIVEIFGERFINCKIGDIEFIDGGKIEGADYEFAKIFKVNEECEYLKDGKIKIYYKSLNGVNKDKIKMIMDEIKGVWFIVSSKTARYYKMPKMVIIEKNAAGKCYYKFEVVK